MLEDFVKSEVDRIPVKSVDIAASMNKVNSQLYVKNSTTMNL